MMKRVFVSILVFLGVGFNPVIGAQQMAIWDFGQSSAYYTEVPTVENVIGTPTLVLSGGEKDLNGKNGVAYVDIAGVSHIAGQAAAWEDVAISSDIGPDADWIVTINTAGWQDISVRFDYKAWDPTTTSFDLDYRLSDADPWLEILNNQGITADGAFHSFSYSLSGDIDNQSIVQLRFYDLDEMGNDKFAFDNLEFAGTQIPEPATIVLLGLGVSAILRKRVK
jgi:hypothetical protein